MHRFVTLAGQQERLHLVARVPVDCECLTHFNQELPALFRLDQWFGLIDELDEFLPILGDLIEHTDLRGLVGKKRGLQRQQCVGVRNFVCVVEVADLHHFALSDDVGLVVELAQGVEPGEETDGKQDEHNPEAYGEFCGDFHRGLRMLN